MNDKLITWRQTCRLMAKDRERLRCYLANLPGHTPIWLSLHPSFWAAAIHRVSYYLWQRRMGKLARFGAHCNQLLTGFDINPNSKIGEGLLVTHPTATACGGRAGRNFTLMPLSGIGFTPGEKDIGAGPGLPVLGDNVTVGAAAGIVGPVRIGSRVRIQPGAACFRHVKDDCVVSKAISPKPAELKFDSQTVRDCDNRPHRVCEHRCLSVTLRDLRRDVDRYVEEFTKARGGRATFLRWISALTTMQLIATEIYRLSHFLHANGLHGFAQTVAWFNRIIHKASINPASCIGGGFTLAHPVGAVVNATAAEGLVMYARTLCTSREPAMSGAISLGPSLGEDVVLAANAGIIGVTLIGDRVRLGSDVNLNQSVGSNTVIVSAGIMLRVVHDPEPDVAQELSSNEENRPPCRAMSRIEMRRRLREDRRRLKVILCPDGKRDSSYLSFSPVWLCVWFHRLSHYHYCCGRNGLARLFWQLNAMLTGADINPASDIGGGMVIPYPAGISIHATAGRNLIVMALCSITGGLSDIPGLPGPRGYPVLGDDVHLSDHSGVHGPVRIGNRVHLDSGCFVMNDVPDSTRMLAPRIRVQRMRQAPAEADIRSFTVGQYSSKSSAL